MRRPHYYIGPVNLEGLFPDRPPLTWAERIAKVFRLYSTVATILFTLWLVVPATADSEAVREDKPWTVLRPLLISCMQNGGFEYKNQLFACRHAGSVGGDVRPPEDMPLDQRQAHVLRHLPKEVYGRWIPY